MAQGDSAPGTYTRLSTTTTKIRYRTVQEPLLPVFAVLRGGKGGGEGKSEHGFKRPVPFRPTHATNTEQAREGSGRTFRQCWSRKTAGRLPSASEEALSASASEAAKDPSVATRYEMKTSKQAEGQKSGLAGS